MIDETLGQLTDAVKKGDAQLVSRLLRERDQHELENTVKEVSRLQADIVAKEEERDALRRELEHLSEPIQVAAKAYASALERLEECHLDLAQLQARQVIIDLGLESRREEINELRKQLTEMMEVISK